MQAGVPEKRGEQNMSENQIDIKNIPVHLLAINASNRKNSNSQILMDQALEQLKESEWLEIHTLCTYNKRYAPYDKPEDFEAFVMEWKWADAILIFMPVYTAAGPGLIYQAFDRLADVMEPEIRAGIYNKVGAAVIQGSQVYGMEELALENTIDVLAALHVWPLHRLAGRIPDKQKPEDPVLFQSIRNVAKELVEVTRMVKLGYQEEPSRPARIAVLNAGVDDPEIGDALAERILGRLECLPGITAESFRFAGKQFRDCHHCNANCGKTFRCIFQDGFQEFFCKWLRADGLIWIASANQPGPPAAVRCVHDRLSEVGFSTVSYRVRTEGVPYRFAQYTRPEASVVYGRRHYGGQSWAQQFFINVAQQRGSFYLTGREKGSFGPAALLRTEEQLGCEQSFLEEVDTLTDDVAAFARRLQTVKQAAYESIPELYYPSRTKMGITNKEDYFNGGEE